MPVLWRLFSILFVVLAAVPALAQSKTFLADKLGATARALEQRIASEARAMASANPALASQLQNQVDAALQSGDRPKAELGLRLRAASAPKTSAPWIRLARFYLDAPPSTYKERTTPEAASDFALPASYLGYLKSVSNADQLAALRLIEEALRRAQQTNVYTAEFEDERALARAVADVGKERVALGDRSASRAASADDNTFDVEGDPEIKLNRKQAEVCIRFTSQPAAKNLGRSR